MSSLKIYFKSHNTENDTLLTSDVDRSHLPIFYANNCDIYVTQSVWDANTGNLGIDIGSSWSFIDPCVAASLDDSNRPDIGLLPMFNCGYCCYFIGSDDVNGVHKIGLPPTTELSLTKVDFVSVESEAPATPINEKTGLHYVQLNTPSGQNILVANYSQAGELGNTQQFVNMLYIISQLITLSSSGGGLPFILLVSIKATASEMRSSVTSNFPMLSVFPNYPLITDTNLTSSTSLSVQNNYMIITNSLNIGVKVVPPITPVKYNAVEFGALIVTVNNIPTSTSFTSNQSLVNFNTKPELVTLSLDL